MNLSRCWRGGFSGSGIKIGVLSGWRGFAAGADGFILPFVENYRYLSNLIAETPGDFSAQVTALAEPYQQRQAQLLQTTRHPEGFSVLTQRELELTELMAQHLSNKEIAQRLYLSEGTVKQYINQIYSKLQITGDTRTKRKELLSRMQAKT